MEPNKISNRLEFVLHQNSSTSSSPLRRSFQNNALSTVFSVNDDEAERIARRREILNSTSSTISSRQSLGLGFLANIPAPQMVERINQCIKLNAENKINVKNAFSLEIIDFMTYMIKKQDANMSNLQVASTSLDVSTKIYGYRVDGVHTDTFKIAGGLEQAVDDAEQNADEPRIDAEAAEANVIVQRKKKKKKSKIFNTVEALRGNIVIQKPMSAMLGDGDSQTSDMLYQATLPHHANSGYYLHLYNDVLVDVVENDSEPQNDSDTRFSTPVIDEFSNLEICASYSNFEFLGWSVEDEPEEEANLETNDNGESNRFHFDLDVSVEPDDGNNNPPEPMNFFDFQDNNVNECHQQVADQRNENIADVRNVRVSTTTTSEYSFQPSINLHWVGPFHWKFRNIAKLTPSIREAHCAQAARRKRKPIKLSYRENREAIDAKFVLSQFNRFQAKTAMEWDVEALLLPEDVHYDIGQMMKQYLNPRLILTWQNDCNNNAVDVLSDNEQYDYNNPNDTLEYCPDTNTGDDHGEGGRDLEDNAIALGSQDIGDDCEEEDGDLEDNALGQNFIGDNLVAAPRLADKIPVTYCSKAKKIDMRQLKKSIWRLSTDNVDVANTDEMENSEAAKMKESKKFSDIYKALPKLLMKSNAEVLSVPISFVSLLHLANEKSLQLHSLPDLSDIIIESESD